MCVLPSELSNLGILSLYLIAGTTTSCSRAIQGKEEGGEKGAGVGADEKGVHPGGGREVEHCRSQRREGGGGEADEGGGREVGGTSTLQHLAAGGAWEAAREGGPAARSPWGPVPRPCRRGGG
jgi:hypothetical protein